MATPWMTVKSAVDQVPIGFVPCHVRTGQQFRRAGRDGQSPACIEERKVIPFGRGAIADRSELDEAGVGAGFAAWPVVTHPECRNAIGIFNQDRMPRPCACVALISADRSRPGSDRLIS
jgi:hypothetical protein